MDQGRSGPSRPDGLGMSRYEWPAEVSGAADDPAGRVGYWQARRGSIHPSRVRQAAALRMEHELATDAGVAVALAPRSLRRARRGNPAVMFAPAGTNDLWLPLGPTTVIKSQFTDTPRISGRVRDLAVSDDGQRIYAATGNGGVWYSGDGGVTWIALGAYTAASFGTDQPKNPANSLSCGSIHVRFGATEFGDDVVVGTGELAERHIFGSTLGHPGVQFAGVGVLTALAPVPDVLANASFNPWSLEGTNLAGSGIYRVVRDPADPTSLVAASSSGIYSRVTAAAVTWTKYNKQSLDDPKVMITDAAWAPAKGPIPKRLWVAVQDDRPGAPAAGLWFSTTGPAGPFTRVVLPGVTARCRLGIAVPDVNPGVVYVLGDGPLLWRVDEGVSPSPPAASPIASGLPPDTATATRFFAASYWSLAISTFPGVDDQIMIGGGGTGTDANIYHGKLTGAAGAYALTDPTVPASPLRLIGQGVHSDVHRIAFSSGPVPAVCWVGCDGGVFRSDAAGGPATFYAANTGLGVIEPGYVASHATNDAYVVTGTQDNGTLGRAGDTLWIPRNFGDGGGVMFHPSQRERYIHQFTNDDWRRDDDTAISPLVNKPAAPAVDAEQSASSFYSEPAFVNRPASGATAAIDRLAVGTNRVWYSADFGATWATLPSNTNPRATAAVNYALDVQFPASDATILGCRWITPDRLLAISLRGICLYVAPEDAGNATGKWAATVIASKHKPKCSAVMKANDISSPSDFLPPFGAWNDVATHTAPSGGAAVTDPGTFYVAVAGDETAEEMDSVWWHDGAAKQWYATGLHVKGNTDPLRTEAPAYAVIVDPDHADLVYVGTAVGVWRGELTVNGTTPSWVWKPFANGLPEAAVQDLSVFKHTNANGVVVKLLRAAVQARGVWEVDITSTTSTVSTVHVATTYLRATGSDSRRRAPTDFTDPTKAAGTVALSWHASPDIVIRPASGAIYNPPGFRTGPPRLPPITASPGPAPDLDVWAIQTALKGAAAVSNPLLRADGQWSPAFQRQVHATRVARGLADPVAATIDLALWNAVKAHAFDDPWPGEPTEADLAEVVVARASANPAGLVDPQTFPSMAIGKVKTRVHVMVHRRDLAAADPTNVFVGLFLHALPKEPADWPTMAVSAGVRTAMEQLLQGHGTPPNGWTLPDGWTLASNAQKARSPSKPIDAFHPRPVTFDVNLTSLDKKQAWIMLAVVHHDGIDPVVLSGTNLFDLVSINHQVAARSFELRTKV